jgi:uncharacterized RDD family membrane protein YckC
MLMKRFIAAVYELLILVAIWLLCTLLYVMLVGDATQGWARLGLQLVLWLSAGAYFVRCWMRSGQTLATQTWKLKLVNANGQLLTANQAILRYIIASIGVIAFGAGFLWALFDRDQLYLHDRLLGTRWLIH